MKVKVMDWSEFKQNPRQAEPVQVRMWKAIRFTAIPAGYADQKDAEIARLQARVAKLEGEAIPKTHTLRAATADGEDWLKGLPAQDRKYMERKLGKVAFKDAPADDLSTRGVARMSAKRGRRPNP